MTRNTLRPLWLAALAVAVAGLTLPFSAPASAGELGHFSPAIADIRDYLMPAQPGFAAKLYTYYYTTQTFRNANGDKVSTIPLPGGGTATLNVDVGIYVVASAFLYISDREVLGGHYGAYILPPSATRSSASSTRPGTPPPPSNGRTSSAPRTASRATTSP
jgi:hypothetical protein